MNLTLTKEEIQYIINVLGELPTKSGAWPLILKIKEQAEQQLQESSE
jgi:hypothetical protein